MENVARKCEPYMLKSETICDKECMTLETIAPFQHWFVLHCR